MLGLIRDGLTKDSQKWSKLAKNLVGVSEETTTGVKRLYDMQVRLPCLVHGLWLLNLAVLMLSCMSNHEAGLLKMLIETNGLLELTMPKRTLHVCLCSCWFCSSCHRGLELAECLAKSVPFGPVRARLWSPIASDWPSCVRWSILFLGDNSILMGMSKSNVLSFSVFGEPGLFCQWATFCLSRSIALV